MLNKRIVLAFVENSAGRILLTKRSEKEKVRGGEWYIPGGHCKKGEAFLDCLKRELKEELRATIKGIIKEAEPIHKDAYNATYEIKIFRVSLNENKFELKTNEITEIMWIDPEQLTKYVSSKSIPEYYELIYSSKE